MKRISVVTPCYNEEENVETIYAEVKKVMAEFPAYRYEHLFIDNASTDNTAQLLKQIAAADKNVKIIVNNRNFGPLRSPYYGLINAYGDAVILIVADLQEPPELIRDFIRHWEQGEKLVLGIKTNSEENGLFYFLRSLYYSGLNKISDTKLLKHTTGFGLYDKEILDTLRSLHDCYPYLRGLISELGYPVCEVPYYQLARKRGLSKSNFYILYDWAMLGMTSHSKIPLRLATMLGFVFAILSFGVSMFYLIYKLIFWNSFSLGTAPIVIGFFLLASVQLFFIGIIGEYVGAIHTQTLNRPLVTEKERINFDEIPDALQSPAYSL